MTAMAIAVLSSMAGSAQQTGAGGTSGVVMHYGPLPRSLGEMERMAQATIVGRVTRELPLRIFTYTDGAIPSHFPRTPFRVTVTDVLAVSDGLEAGKTIEVCQDGTPPGRGPSIVSVRPQPDRFLTEGSDYLLFLIRLPDDSWGFQFGAASFARLDRATGTVDVPGAWVQMNERLGAFGPTKIDALLDRLRTPKTPPSFASERVAH